MIDRVARLIPAVSAAAGVLAALAVWFYIPAPAPHPAQDAADGAAASSGFASATPRVLSGSSLAVEYRSVESPYADSVADALLDMTGADGKGASKTARFMELSGLSSSRVRWAVFSMGSVAMPRDGVPPAPPEGALAVSMKHDLRKIVSAYESLRTGDSPVKGFKSSTVEGLEAWEFDMAIPDGEYGPGSILRPTLHALSLGGEILILAGSREKLAAQARLFASGEGEDARFASTGSGDDMFRVFLPDLGAFLSFLSGGAPGAFDALDEILPDGAKAVTNLGECDFSVSVADSSAGGLEFRVSARAASAADADNLATLAKAAALAGTARTDGRDGSGGDPAQDRLRGILSGLRVSSERDIVRASVAITDSEARSAANAVMASLGI